MTTDEKDTGNQCRRCGTCCRRGGPALHREDLPLLSGGFLNTDELITIRPGEPVYSPLVDGLETTRHEFLKVAGDRDWTCIFFRADDNSCLRYEHRPVECRLLNCRDTGALEEIIGRELLTRHDLLKDDTDARSIMDAYTRIWPGERLLSLFNAADSGRNAQAREELTRRVQQDLAFRAELALDRGISPGREFFLIGRPLFVVLSGLGLEIRESAGGVCLVFCAEAGNTKILQTGPAPGS